MLSRPSSIVEIGHDCFLMTCYKNFIIKLDMNKKSKWRPYQVGIFRQFDKQINSIKNFINGKIIIEFEENQSSVYKIIDSF